MQVQCLSYVLINYTIFSIRVSYFHFALFSTSVFDFYKVCCGMFLISVMNVLSSYSLLDPGVITFDRYFNNNVLCPSRTLRLCYLNKTKKD